MLGTTRPGDHPPACPWKRRGAVAGEPADPGRYFRGVQPETRILGLVAGLVAIATSPPFRTADQELRLRDSRINRMAIASEPSTTVAP